MQRTQTICLILLTVIAVAFSLTYLESVLLPFIIACFVVIGIRPLLELLQTRFRLSRMLAVCVAFVIGLSGLAAIGTMIAVSVQQVAVNRGAYEQRLTTIGNWVSNRSEALHLRRESHSDRDDPTTATSESAGDDESPASMAIRRIVTQLDAIMLSLVGSMSTLLSFGIMIVLFVFFLLLGDESPDVRAPQVISDIEDGVRKYLVMKTLISMVTGAVFGGVLWLFTVPLAVVFGMSAFLLNFIPNIGPLLATVLPVPFLVLNAQISPTSAVTCISLICGVQFISGNVVEPRLMGKSLDVSPVALLLALMFFGLIWGIIGMFLATPLVSIVKIALQNTKSGRPVAELLAGRWVSAEQVA